MLEEFAEINEVAKKLAKAFWLALTLILPKKIKLFPTWQFQTLKL